jgi:TonB family protein
MTLLNQVSGGMATGIFLSALIHAGLGGGLYYGLKIEPPPSIVAELDLSTTSLLPAAPPPPPPPPAAAFGSGSAPATGTEPGSIRAAPRKQGVSAFPSVKEKPAKPAIPISPVNSELLGLPFEETEAASDNTASSGETHELTETAAREEAVSVAAVESDELLGIRQGQQAGIPEGVVGGVPGGEGVPGGVVGGQPGGVPGGERGGIPGGQRGEAAGGQLGGIPGGSVGGSGRYLSASQVAQPPRWVGNLIGPGDYPRLARREGKDGRVLLSVFIDETGRVRDVRLLQGSDDILNEVALRKVREAVFTPAQSQEGRPVPCKVTLPIRFQLQ